MERLAGTQGHTLRVGALVALVSILTAAGVLLWARSGFAVPPQIFMHGPAALLGLTAATITQTVSGVILTVRRPDNRLGWLILVFAVALALTIFVDGYLALAATGWSAPIEPAALALIPGAITLPFGTLASSGTGFLFPDGRLAVRRARPFLAASAFGALLFAVGVVGMPGPILSFPTIENPIVPAGALTAPFLAAQLGGAALFTLGVVAMGSGLIIRYRIADAIGRLQMRWYLAAAVVLTVTFFGFVIAIFTLPTSSSIGEVIETVFYAACGLPPVALVIAITRYRLFDIDAIIGRAFVFGAMTAILAGLFAAASRIFEAIFVGLTGERSDLVLVLSTLVLATTFTPLKARLDRFVEARMSTGPAQLPTPFDDPAFVAALEARIRAVVAEEGRSNDRS
jgi:hypothetical protein